MIGKLIAYRFAYENKLHEHRGTIMDKITHMHRFPHEVASGQGGTLQVNGAFPVTVYMVQPEGKKYFTIVHPEEILYEVE